MFRRASSSGVGSPAKGDRRGAICGRGFAAAVVVFALAELVLRGLELLAQAVHVLLDVPERVREIEGTGRAAAFAPARAARTRSRAGPGRGGADSGRSSTRTPGALCARAGAIRLRSLRLGALALFRFVVLGVFAVALLRAGGRARARRASSSSKGWSAPGVLGVLERRGLFRSALAGARAGLAHGRGDELGDFLGKIGDFGVERLAPFAIPAAEAFRDDLDGRGVQLAEPAGGGAPLQDPELGDRRMRQPEDDHDGRVEHDVGLVRLQVGERHLRHPRLGAADEDIRKGVRVLLADRAGFLVADVLRDAQRDLQRGGDVLFEEAAREAQPDAPRGIGIDARQAGEQAGAKGGLHLLPDGGDGIDADEPRELRQRVDGAGDAGAAIDERFLQQLRRALFIGRRKAVLRGFQRELVQGVVGGGSGRFRPRPGACVGGIGRLAVVGLIGALSAGAGGGSGRAAGWSSCRVSATCSASGERGSPASGSGWASIGKGGAIKRVSPEGRKKQIGAARALNRSGQGGPGV